MIKILPFVLAFAVAPAASAFIMPDESKLLPNVYSWKNGYSIHYSTPEKCDFLEKCARVDAVIKGPGGLRYNARRLHTSLPGVTFEASSVLITTNTFTLNCKEKSTPFVLFTPKGQRSLSTEIFQNWVCNEAHPLSFGEKIKLGLQIGTLCSGKPTTSEKQACIKDLRAIYFKP